MGYRTWAVMARYILGLVVVLTPTYLHGQDKQVDGKCGQGTNDFCSVELESVYDGDTIKVHLADQHPLFGDKLGIRIAGIDTPELRTKDHKCEKIKAKEAKAVVEKLLTSAKQINLLNCERGKYFRLVCDTYADSTPVAQVLLSKGLAYSYDGGKKQQVDW